MYIQLIFTSIVLCLSGVCVICTRMSGETDTATNGSVKDVDVTTPISQGKITRNRVSSSDFSQMQDMARVVIHYKGAFQALNKSMADRVLKTPLRQTSSWPVYTFCKRTDAGTSLRFGGMTTTKSIGSLNGHYRGHYKKPSDSSGKKVRSKKNAGAEDQCTVFSVSVDRFKGHQQVWLVDSSWRGITKVKKLQKVRVVDDVDVVPSAAKTLATTESLSTSSRTSDRTSVSSTTQVRHASKNTDEFTTVVSSSSLENDEEFNDEKDFNEDDEDDGDDDKEVTNVEDTTIKERTYSPHYNHDSNNDSLVNETIKLHNANNNSNAETHMLTLNNITQPSKIDGDEESPIKSIIFDHVDGNINQSIAKNTTLHTYLGLGTDNNTTTPFVNTSSTRSVAEKQELQKTYISQLLNCVSRLFSKIAKP